MTTSPLVSIIVPIYNVKKYLNKCIESAVGQSYKNIEIVLVDDGSTDESGVLCDTWAKKDPRIKVVHKDNEGLNYARRDGFITSSGKYVTFLDSDDFFDKDTIERSLKLLLDTKADIAVFASKEFSYNDTNEAIFERDDTHETSVLTTKDAIAHYAFFGDGRLPGVQYMTVWGKLYKRELLNKVDWTAANYRIYEDNFWTPQAFLEAKKVVLTSEPLLFYRRNVPYGASGENLSNRMTGNTVNGEPVGYIEFVEQLRKFYQKLARTYGFKSTLDKRIDEQAFLGKTWRIDNLDRAGILDTENNLEYIIDILQEYIEAKNRHIDNLAADIVHLHKELEVSNEAHAKTAEKLEQLAKEHEQLAKEHEQLAKEHEEFSGIKRSARLLAGNIKRRIAKPKS